jgi:hypothetical protein
MMAARIFLFIILVIYGKKKETYRFGDGEAR